jgi:hypothetical protein
LQKLVIGGAGGRYVIDLGGSVACHPRCVFNPGSGDDLQLFAFNGTAGAKHGLGHTMVSWYIGALAGATSPASQLEIDCTSVNVALQLPLLRTFCDSMATQSLSLQMKTNAERLNDRTFLIWPTGKFFSEENNVETGEIPW